MRKKTVALGLCLAMLLTCCLAGLVVPASAAPVDLLGDGDFESETLSNYWSWNSATYSIIHETGSPIKHHPEDDGNHCLMFPAVETETETGTSYLKYTKFIGRAPVVLNTVYRLTFRYKGSGLTLRSESKFLAEGERAGTFNLPEVADWTDYSYVFKTRETEAFTATNTVVGFGHTATDGTAYVDDVRLFEVIEPTNIAFSASTVMLGKGQTKALSVIARPDGADVEGAVTFTSSNTSAVTVDANGVVTAVSTGVSYITATVGDLSTTCTVMVDPYAPVMLGDFEDDTLKGWKYNNKTYAILHETGSPMCVEKESNGNHYLYIPAKKNSDTDTTYTSYSRYYQNLPVKGSTKYKLSFRYWGTGLLVRTSTSGSGKNLPNVSDWTSYSVEFTTAASLGTYMVGVGHQAIAGEGGIDDVTLTEVSMFNELLVDGDLQAETLSTNWNNFLSEDAVTHAVDPDDATNKCLKVVGSKVKNYKTISGAKNDTYYLFSFRHKGSGKVAVSFSRSYVSEESVAVLNTDKYSDTLTSDTKKMFIDTQGEWQTINIVFKTGASTNNTWILQFGSYGATSTVYLDDFSMIELGGAYAQEGLLGGSVSISDGTNNGTTLSDLLNKTVIATVTPDEGYLLVPGSLRYLTADGVTYRILNKDTDTFGAGNTFAFDMPINNVRILADFVKADTTDFAWGTIGTSVHYDDNEAIDGIRFLTRVNMTAFDELASGYTLKHNGEAYTLKSLGLLLKRSANDTELTLENYTSYATAANEERIWGVEVYSSASNTFRLTDYTDGYIDYTIVMMTATPNDTFNERLYTARGYLVLEKEGVETVLYAGERTDSVDTSLARANGEASDVIIGGDTGSSGGNSGGDEVETPEAAIPEDDQDYTNADLKILSIGNSYSQDAQAYLANIAKEQGKLFKCVNLYKSGCSLQTHYNNWMGNTPAYAYELNGTSGTDYSALVSLKAVLESDTFDIVTLQQSSWASVNYSTYQPYLDNLIAVIREKQPNATIYIQQTWAYGDAHTNHTSNSSYTGGTMEAMWTKVEAAYNSAASATGLALIPSGQAIQNAQEALNAGSYSATSIQRDNAHVSTTWGRYLLGRVWYQMFTDDVPTVTLDQLNTSVTADAAMEKVVTDAAAAAFAEYAAHPVEMEAAA